MSHDTDSRPGIPSFPDEHRKHGAETYLTTDISASAMASLFSAAAELYRVHPWKLVPNDTCLIGCSISDLGIEDTVISIIGQQQQCFGLLLLRNAHEYETFTRACINSGLGKPAQFPPYWLINFDVETALPATLRREIAEHGWEIAGEAAHPAFMVTDENGKVRELDTDDLVVLECVARGLAKVAREPEKLIRVWSHGETISELSPIECQRGDIGVWVAAPTTPTSGRSTPMPGPLKI